ncbi:MAG: hypothetical protein K9J79_09275 [Desulfobacteraceae bacterium]|nr:hypothetical protein [Desulfobacteraceae bacterium]
MAKWIFIIDVEKCEDCNNCFLACKDEHVGNDWPKYSVAQPTHGQRWINIFSKERGQYPMVDVAYRPTPCMHCDNAPCIAAAKDNSVYKRKDGIVLIDPVKAKGRHDLVKACPYGVIWWNEEKEVAQKCSFCAHLLDNGWKTPRCVQVCPTGALEVMLCEEDKIRELIETNDLRVLHPEYDTVPRVYYKNLYRFDRCFIAGSVAVEKEGIVDCAEGATAVLYSDQAESQEITTDCFGDFKFDNLPPNSGEYKIEITYQNYSPVRTAISLKESLNLGVMTV